MIRRKQAAISVKSQRWPRPRKDSVNQRIRNDCNTVRGNTHGSAAPSAEVKIQSELTI